MALTIKLTSVGRAALVAAGNLGTLPVTIAQIGVTATAFTAAVDGSDTVLPGELKRLTTFGGAAVAPDTLHAVIRDDSADTYSLRGFGLYLSDGTLFALYGQATAILEKSSLAMALLATDIIFADIDSASITFGDTAFLNPPATETVQGVVELATDAEAITGTDAVRAVTPKGLLAVLTARFGAGNPSAFVKTLLDKISALAFVTALGIRGAASFDTGAGNGLDADLLDGQQGAYYRAYGNLTGVPGTFPPSVHGHAWGDLSGVPAYASRWAAWGEVTGKPVTFTPSAHSHAIGDVNLLQGVLDAKAALSSPALTGVPTAPTAAAGTNTAQIATCAMVQAAIAAALASYLPKNNPTFTGTLTGPAFNKAP